LKLATLQLHRVRRQLQRAFTLVELMVVVALLAILATLVAPGLVNASAPLPQTIISTIEIDMRRACIEAWWIATVARPDEPIPGTTRILGNGSLQPFKDYTLAVTVNGEDPSLGDARIVTFNTVGARDSGVVTLRLINSPLKSLTLTDADTEPQWRLESERTRFDIGK
jgi:prepilin-type N-terminal cleavage/methylation domain-containing protein